jgi:hypothetical protein
MVIGPAIGLWLFQTYWTPVTVNDEAGFASSSILWHVNGLVSVITLLP